MTNIGKHYKNISEYKWKQPACCPHGGYYTTCCAQSLASADFDGDLIADHVFLYNRKIKFFYSTHRPKGVLPFAQQYVSDIVDIPVPHECKMPNAIRIIDIDNDGLEEILVMCRADPHKILFYTRVSDNIKDGWVLNDGCPYGDLNNLSELATWTEGDLKEACNDRHNNVVANHICEIRSGLRERTFFLEAMTTVDMNNDGYLDLILAYGMGHMTFLYNKPIGQLNRFIAFKLKGSKSNIHAIGSTVILYYAKKMCTNTATTKESCSNNRLETQFREVSSYQHASDNQGYIDDRIIFGLGKEGVPLKLLVRWPSGSSQSYNLDNWVYSPKLKVVEIVEY